MRAMYYTASTVDAPTLHHHGSVYRVVPRGRARRRGAGGRRGDRRQGHPGHPRAKEALNGIDVQDVHRSYRFEQGFTFELNLAGVADEHRQAFVDSKGR